MIYFTSDTHYGHDNIIKYSNRPFSNIQEMNEKMIDNWNLIIKNNDDVYHIGDFAFGNGLKNPEQYFNRLNGRKHLIKGNHDYGCKTLNLPWDSINDYLEIVYKNQKIVLMHYSMRVWHHSYKDTWNLYGHSHGTLIEEDKLAFDVGVDVWDFKPVSFTQVKNKMLFKKKNTTFFKEYLKEFSGSEIHNRQLDVAKKIMEFNKRFW